MEVAPRRVRTRPRQRRGQLVHGYGVHLLFHVLAVLLGTAIGVAAAMWWTAPTVLGLVVTAAAIVLGVVLLLLQNSVLRAPQLPPRPDSYPSPEQPRRGGTRPELRNEPRSEDSTTRVINEEGSTGG